MDKKFSTNAEILKSDGETGVFEGVLIKGEVLDSYRDYFSSESIKGFKTKDGTNKVFLLHQHQKDKELGVMEIWEEKGDLKFKAELDLSVDNNNNFINKDAAKVYSLMKKGAKYDMSVGGRILKGEYGNVETEKGEVNAYIIKEFEVWEGSTVLKGAVPGAKVETYKKLEEEKMDLKEQFESYKTQTTKAIEDLKDTIAKGDIKEETKEKLEKMQADMQEKLDEFEKGINDGIETKLDEFAREFKSIEESKKELSDSDFEKAVADFMQKNNSGTTNKSVDFKEYMEKATATTAVPQAILPQLSRVILRRVQEKKNVWAYVSKMSMREHQLTVPREVLGMPEVNFIAETGNRVETNINFLDEVEFKLHQIYALPVFTNKLLATDVVGFVSLVLERVAEAFAKKLSEKVMYGTGTGEPAGILTNTDVLANSLTFTSAGLVDYDTITKAKYRLDEEYASKSFIVMNRRSAEHFMNLKDLQGRPIFLQAYTAGVQDTISSIPVIYDDTLPVYDNATPGDVVCLIGDMTKYLGVTHADYSLRLEDKITNKGYTAYYFETMAGGNVLLPEAFIPIKKA